MNSASERESERASEEANLRMTERECEADSV